MTSLRLTSGTADLSRGRFVRGEEVVQLTSRETDLLRYLAEHPARVVPRDELLAHVWGYSDAVVSRASDNAVRRLREKIEADPTRPDHLLTVHGVGYRFEIEPGAPPAAADPPPPVWVTLDEGVAVDVTRRRVRRGADEDTLNEVDAVLLRTLLAAEGVVEREVLIRAAWGRPHRRDQRLDGAVARLRRRIERDPDAPRILVTRRGVGYELVRPEARTEAPPLHPALVGRADLLAELTAALQRHRWVVLLGPGGIGKSTLARAAAQHLGPDGTWWADLSASERIAQAARTVATTLGIDLGDDDPVERVGGALAQRPGAVLVLDNLEGLAEAADLVDRWRALAPHARLLGTSRLRPGAADEHVIEVGPLPPDAAAALFVTRAHSAASANRDLQPDDPRVASIVERLERIPLAIELAAARTAVMSPAQLAERLTVDLLHQTRPHRHGSLVGVIAATLRGMNEAQAEALAVLSLFRDGFDVGDVELLLGWLGDGPDLVQALRDHSVVRRLPNERDAVRFAVWQAVREVLAGSVSPEHERRWCRHLARWGEPELLDRLGWVGYDDATAELLAQVGDVERAAHRALALGEVDVAARCAAAVLWVCTSRGPFVAGLALARGVLDAGPSEAERARLLFGAGTLHAKLGDWHEALSVALAAAERAAAIDDPWLESQACNLVASMQDNLGTEPDAVVAYQRRSLLAVQRTGLQDGTLEDREAALHRRLGQREDQRRALRRAQRRAAEIGNRPLWWKVTCLLGQEERTAGDFVTARATFEQVIRACDGPALRSARLQAVTLLVEMVFMMGDRDAGRRWAQVTVDLARQMGSRVDECRGYLAIAHATLDLADLEPIDAALGTSAASSIVACDAEVLRAQLLRERGAFEASVRAAERAVEIDETAGSPDTSIAVSELAMSLLAAGRVARAREVFDRLAPPVGVYRMYRRCQAALLERAEGRRTELDVAEIGALADASGVTLPHNVDGVLTQLLGPWAVVVWARGPG